MPIIRGLLTTAGFDGVVKLFCGGSTTQSLFCGRLNEHYQTKNSLLLSFWYKKIRLYHAYENRDNINYSRINLETNFAIFITPQENIFSDRGILNKTDGAQVFLRYEGGACVIGPHFSKPLHYKISAISYAAMRTIIEKYWKEEINGFYAGKN